MDLNEAGVSIGCIFYSRAKWQQCAVTLIFFDHCFFFHSIWTFIHCSNESGGDFQEEIIVALCWRWTRFLNSQCSEVTLSSQQQCWSDKIHIKNDLLLKLRKNFRSS